MSSFPFGPYQLRARQLETLEQSLERKISHHLDGYVSAGRIVMEPGGLAAIL